MAKKNSYNNAADFDGFDDLMGETKNSVQLGVEALSKKEHERPTKGAAAGCKPGSSRKTFVLPLELIDKLEAIAVHTRQKEVAVVLEMLEKGVKAYEQQYGSEITSLPKFNVNN